MRPIGETIMAQDEAVEAATQIWSREVKAVARNGGLKALDRLSDTLSYVCAALSEHLRTAPSDTEERRILDRLATATGDVFVAVRLARFEARSQLQQGTPPQPGNGIVVGGAEATSLGEADTRHVHHAQWIAAEACYRFLVEWEDSEVHTAENADRLRSDLAGLAGAVEESRRLLPVRSEKSRLENTFPAY